jgi:heat-inducible transcriptional repressor
MIRPQLTQRQEQVLYATVQHYIATAEPVGSKVLAQGYDFSVSPATIRNAMGFLERAGLLYQPHTSAGRVPSDSGYRVYVDRLVRPSLTQSRRVEQMLSDRLDALGWSLEAVLRGATQILAMLSGYIALITFPQTTVTSIRHVQVVPVDPQRAMLILVTDSYETHSSLFEIPLNTARFGSDGDASGRPAEPLDPEQVTQELQLLSNFLNHQLQSCPLGDLASLDWQELGQAFEHYGDRLRSLFEELVQRTQLPPTTQILVSGVSEVLRQPEFNELQQFQNLMELLEGQQSLLWPLIFQTPDNSLNGLNGLSGLSGLEDQRTTIRIGSENPLAPMQSCAMVSSLYHRGSTPVGSVGIVGPTRMAYGEAIAAVEATADYLTDIFSA